ncbi:MAG: hypothetical protein Q4A23_03095 [bacterium]|nr:hypothetical protein [bacterium]
MGHNKTFFYVILVILSTLFTSFIFSGKVFAVQKVIPTAIREELEKKCRGGRYNELTYDGREKFFSMYSGLNNHISTNWISSDEASRDIVTSLRIKNKKDIDSNTTLYMNYAAIGCQQSGQGNFRIVNIKIEKTNETLKKFIIDPKEAHGVLGEGLQAPAVSLTNFSISHIFQFKLKFNLANFSEGENIINYKTRHCITDDGGAYNQPASVEADDDDYHCMYNDSQLRVIVKNKKYQTQARSFVKVKQGWRNLRETVGVRNGKPITAKVGETIQFGHKLTNLGDASNDKIASTLIHGNRNYMDAHRLGGGDTISYYQGNGKISRSNKRNNEVFAETGNGVNNQLSGRYLSLDIKPEHAGKTFCSDIVFTKTGARTDNTNPINDNYQFEDPTGIGTYPACVYVPYDNDVQPCMGNGGSNSCGGEPEGEPGTKITGVPKIKNGGGTNTPSNTQWIITKWEVPSNKENVPIPSQIDNEEKDPCRHYRSKFDNSASNCGVVAKSGSGDNSIGANATLTNFGNISAIQNFSVPENAQIGTRFCFAISVSPRTLKDSDTPEKQAQVTGKEWRHSAPLCFKVIKRPKLQVWGGGIFSRRGIRGNNSIYETKGTFSSWGEFEAMAGREGRIINFTSASSNTGTKLNFGNASSGWEELLGRSKDSHISSIAAAYGTATRNDASRRVAVENYNNATLDGANADTAQRYGDGWTRIIYARNLFINSNITSRNNIANGIQQTIIVADNIRISNKVDRIDAWIITRGNGVVNTCAQTANNDTISYVNEANCSRQLKINGSILTNRFLPWRTAYSDIKNPDKPSEIINQRADSYLWANRQTGNIGRTVRTTYSKELPIRY